MLAKGVSLIPKERDSKIFPGTIVCIKFIHSIYNTELIGLCLYYSLQMPTVQ